MEEKGEVDKMYGSLLLSMARETKIDEREAEKEVVIFLPYVYQEKEKMGEKEKDENGGATATRYRGRENIVEEKG